MRPRSSNQVSCSRGLSDGFRRDHGSPAKPGGTLPRGCPTRASGNKGLTFSRNVAEPPENGASTDGGIELKRQNSEDKAEPWAQPPPHLAIVLVS